MNHVDEGTIHAWLDGALNATQSAEVDAHVKSCAECSAKVAEARGLIAASSRILVSLDDTPANVIPKKAPVAPRRSWRAAPWVSGLAAAAILVVLWRSSDVVQPKRTAEIAVPKIDLISNVPEPSLERLKEPAPPPPAAKAPTFADGRQSRVGNQARAEEGRAAGSGAGVASVGAVATTQTAPAAVASDLAARGAVEESRKEALRSEALSRSREDAQSRRAALIPAPTSVADMAKLAADSVSPWLGCYRVAPVTPRQDVVTSAAAEVASVARRSARAPSPAAAGAAAPAAAAAPTAKSADQSAAFTVVRLDSARGTQGFLVRDVATGALRGTWQQVGADSVRLVLPEGPRIIGSRVRVACPEE